MVSISSVLQLLAVSIIATLVYAGTKDKPHAHNGKVTPYDGGHMGYELTADQTKSLNAGQPVTSNVREGSSGRGIVIQDVNASPEVCMSKIMDLRSYPGIVPKVKKVDIYEEEKLPSGHHTMGVEMQVSVFFMTFIYYLQLQYDPSFHTFRWVLDYRYNSDFDENIGKWQVLPHPTKAGWSRVVYSCEAILFPWIPEIVVNWVTKTALVESTTWVKKESEKMARTPAAANLPSVHFPDISDCFTEVDGAARYDPSCMSKQRQQSGRASTTTAESSDTDDTSTQTSDVEDAAAAGAGAEL